MRINNYILYIYNMPPSSRGLGHFPFTEVTGIRIPLGVIINTLYCWVKVNA